MAEPLLYDELTAQQRQMLAALSKHPGWEVLVMVFHKSCDLVNGRLVKLDPMADDYEKKLARAHLQARTVNEFCSAVKTSVEFHAQLEAIQRKVTDASIREELEKADNQLRAGNPVPTYPVESNPKE
jgi:hypothetical protein